MQIKYTADAFASLIQLVNFVESRNTNGAGLRWLVRYEQFLKKSFEHTKHKRTCNNATLKRLNLKCIYFNDWLIAFSIQGNIILIEALLHKSRITD